MASIRPVADGRARKDADGRAREEMQTAMTALAPSRRSLLLGVAATLAFPATLRAASFATRPIRLVVGTAASGTNDLAARLIAPTLREELGQPVVVDNRPGAATTYAVGLVAAAPPDGHVLLVSSAAALAVHATSVNAPPDLARDLSAVGMVCDGAFTYAINSRVEARDTASFIALLREAPGRLNYGTSGAGSAIHLSGELFQQRTGTLMLAVHYTNAGMRANDLVSNTVQLGIGGIGVLGPFIGSGALRALFVAGREREKLLPEMPTSVELGLPELDNITNWFGLHGPKGMPAEIVAQVNAALNKALRKPDVAEAFGKAGMTNPLHTPEQFLARMTADYQVMADVAKARNIRADF